jgi:threonine dehydrogenase-like Zn-dependent dehydrogenase
LPIDPEIPVKAAMLFEPFVVGTRGVRGLKQKAGDSAIVFGAGIIGMTSAIMLDWYGAEKVMVCDFSEFRLENARRLGFETCNLASENLKEKAISLFGSQPGYPDERCGARLYVDAVGVKQVLTNFAMLAPRHGELAVVGVHKEEAPINWTQVCFNNWHIHGTGEGANEELLPDIVAMMKSGKYDLASLVTHEFPVERIEEAIALAAQPDRAQKVCIAF